MGCLISARYNHKADIYEQTTTRDPDTGQTIRNWSYVKTVDCQAIGVISEGIRTVGSTEDYRTSDRSFTDTDWVKLRSAEQISKRSRITNIRNKQSTRAVWYDIDADEPIRFEVLGSQPLPGPFGNTNEYETLCERVQDGLQEQWS